MASTAENQASSEKNKVIIPSELRKTGKEEMDYRLYSYIVFYYYKKPSKK